MRGAVVAGLVAMAVAAPAHADNTVGSTDLPPRYIDHAEWVHWGDLNSLRVYPTAAGRAHAYVGSGVAGAQVWGEILAAAPDADTGGMREQFLCHWDWAEVVQPGKTSWNLEPWRPVVDAEQMLATGCNPGGREEPA